MAILAVVASGCVCLTKTPVFPWLQDAIGQFSFLQSQSPDTASAIDLDSIPEYSESPYIEINGNKPNFSAEEITTDVFEQYSELDSLGRCGVAYANICKELMPTEERGKIGQIKAEWLADGKISRYCRGKLSVQPMPSDCVLSGRGERK